MTGTMERTTWGDVEVGHIVRDKNDRLWTVIEQKDGWLLIQRENDAHVLETVGIPKFDRLEDEAWIYVPSDEEARDLAGAVLGGRLLRMVEEREHTLARALNWRVDPVPRKAVKLRDHIDWLHGVNVDDVLRRHDGTDANPSNPERKKASVEELCRAHDEMHADPDAWPHHYAHHHASLGGTS